MTHPIPRKALILLASAAVLATAGSACAEGLRPNFPIRLSDLPPKAAPAPADAPVATARAEAPKAALRLTPLTVEQRPLAPAATLQPAVQVDEWPVELIKVAARKRSHHTAAKKAERAGPKTYTVRKGDTLDKVADKLGTSVAELKRINRLKGSTIRPGQKLKGPAPAGRDEDAPKASRSSSSRKSSEARSETYTVRRGDTLFSIAKRQGVTVEELKAANGLGRRGAIHAGQKLKLPGAEPEAAEETPPPRRSTRTPVREPEPVAEEETTGNGYRTFTTRSATGHLIDVAGGAATHRVRKGDTLDEVADDFGISVAQLKKLNHLKRSSIRPGQVLKGPRTNAKAYVAAPGDTLAAVARRFSVSPEALASANGLRRNAAVRPGQRLRLPSGYRDRGPVTSTARVPVPVTEVPPSMPPRVREPAPSAPLTTAPPEATPNLPSRPQPYAPSRPTPRYTPPPSNSAGPALAPTPSPALSDAQISQLGAGRFVWPLQGEVLSSFGSKPGGLRNDGLNIRATTGSPVRAAAAGDVVYAGDQVPGFGNLVLIKHPDGWVTAYGHLSRIEVKMQQKVTQGQQIGQAGSTGGVAEPQLHFEIRYGAAGERARPIDPSLVLPR